MRSFVRGPVSRWGGALCGLRAMISSYKLFKVSVRKVGLLSGAYNLNFGNDALVRGYGDF